MRMAHFSVGNEARGGTPEKSETLSKRIEEISSNEERRTEMPAKSAEIVNSTAKKEK
jgi:hypothetical protein